jgi:signal transduction histidine kinase
VIWNHLPRPLRVASFRFAALYVGLFASSALLLGFIVFVEARAALQQQMRARIEAESTFLQQEYHARDLTYLISLVNLRGKGTSALDYLIEGPDGTHLVGEMPAVTGLKPGWTKIEVPHASEDGGAPERVLALVADLGPALLAVGTDLKQIEELEEAIVTAFIWTVGIAALLGIVGGTLLSRAFLRRVDVIVRTAEAIIDGDLTRRVPLGGTGDDLDRLAATLNQMLDRIEMLMESLRQVSTDVAHDLRTPLSRLYQRLEEARQLARTMTDYDAALDAALHEAQGLLETFTALLRIAQVEDASPRAGFSEVDLSAIAETVADAYRLDAEEAGHDLSSAVAHEVTVSGDKELLTQALANLVENSLRHTPPGTRIRVSLDRHSNTEAVLAVEDNGPGVEESDLHRLTGRFYRSERSRTTPGNGLGLTLVSAVADLHDARLTLATLNPGLRVDLAIPTLAK